VHYYVTRREQFAGQRLVIAGGGDSALDWTLNLAELAEKIFVVHRREKFRGAPESVARMHALADAGRVELVVPYQLAGLEGTGGVLSGVVVETLKGERRVLRAEHLLAFFGLSTDLGPIAEWGLALAKSHIAVTPATCETSIPGVFAIGDIASYPGKLKLILQGFSEAAMAAHAIHPLVHPGQALHFEFSTTSGVQGF
jgi:thioredoxin reductase (NADPH)